MPNNFSVDPAILSAVESIKAKNPSLYDILKSYASSINAINNQLNPAAVVSKIVTNATTLPDDVQNFIYRFSSFNVFLSWDAVGGIVNYELRKGGSSFETANYVTTTSSLQIVLDALLVGTTTFWIKAISETGDKSLNATQLDVVVPPIDAPVVQGTSINNTAVLSWVAPSSTFALGSYVITRDAVQIATVNGTFFAYQESAAGTHVYGVSAVDIAGNIGTEATTSITVTAPQDFILQSELTSTFTGAVVNGFVDTERNVLEVCVNDTETWQQHYVNNGFTDAEDQINAGFPYYGEPAETTASYVETFDFGAIFDDVVVGISWLYTLIIGAVGILTSLEFSTDNITYSAPVSGPTAFVSAVRYVRVTIDFTGSNASLLEFFQFICSLSVHREMDGGSGSAVSTDVGGTVFTYNKTFVSVESVTVTADATTNYTCVVTGVSTTQFKVLVFNPAGVRVTTTINWKARGIV